MTTFTVKKVKTDQQGKKRYSEVGTVVVRPDGKTGVLWLSWLDGDFVLFKKADRDTEASEKEAA
jgi:hypothetical protein